MQRLSFSHQLSKGLLSLLLGAAILFSAACAQTPGDTSSTQEVVQQEQSDAAETISTKELTQLHRLASLYESYLDGGSLNAGTAVSPDSSFAFGVLYENDLLEPFRDGISWSVPVKTLAEINALFFETTAEPEDEYVRTYDDAGYWGNMPFNLLLQEVLWLEDGNISATFKREKNDAVLCPVTYVFAPFEAKEIPQPLKSCYRTEDFSYRIVSVTQRTDLLPVKERETIEISTAEELLAAARRINEGRYEDRYDIYLLTADIDLEGLEWTPMGMNNRALEYWEDYERQRDPNLRGFHGIFDGRGHTIKNLTITEEQAKRLLEQNEQNFSDRQISGAGFFYHIGNRGTIKNLKLENATVMLPLEGVPQGASAGLLAASCQGNIENVSVEGKVQGVNNVGGLVGRLSGIDAVGVADNCTAEVEVTGHCEAGGMIGVLHYGLLIDCTASGSVRAVKAGGIYEGETPMNIGGMVGHYLESNVVSCHASVYVLTDVPSRCVGGFAGLAEGGLIQTSSVDADKVGSWELVDDAHRMETVEIEKK